MSLICTIKRPFDLIKHCSFLQKCGLLYKSSKVEKQILHFSQQLLQLVDEEC